MINYGDCHLLNDPSNKNAKRSLYTVFAIALVLTLIALLNISVIVISNLNFRSSEISTRFMVGATKARLFRQLTVESLVHCIAAGVLGLLLGKMLITYNLLYAHRVLPREEGIDLGWNGCIWIVCCVLVSALFVGSINTLYVNIKWGNLSTISGAQAYTSTLHSKNLRRLLFFFQMLFTSVLLIITTYYIRSFRNLLKVDTGFDHRGIVTVELNPRGSDVKVGERIFRAKDELISELQRTDNFASIGLISEAPFFGDHYVSLFGVESDSLESNLKKHAAYIVSVDEDYFVTMGIPVIQGRTFEAFDFPESETVVVIDRMLEEKLWPDESGVGRYLLQEKRDGKVQRQRIIGVVGDVNYTSLRGKSDKNMRYFFIGQRATRLFTELVLRVKEGREYSAEQVKEIVGRVIPDIYVARSGWLRENMMRGERDLQNTSRTVAVFTCLAVIISIVGVFGVSFYEVSHMRREIGIRIAMGADRGSVVRLVMKEIVYIAMFGLTVGCILSVFINTALMDQFFGMPSVDFRVFALVGVVMLCLMLFGALGPIHRALKVQPMEALRYE